MAPPLVDISSSAERLSKSTVTGDHAKPVCSDFAGARSSAIATASVTGKATLDDSVKRAYVKIALNDAARISVPIFKQVQRRATTHTRSVKTFAMSDILMRSATTVIQRVYHHPRGYPVGITHSTKRSYVLERLTGPRPPI